MAGSAAEDSSEESIVIIDDGVPDNPPERSDKVFTQPAENKLKKANGTIESYTLNVDGAFIRNGEKRDNNILKEGKCDEQSQYLDLTLKPAFSRGNGSNDHNHLWSINTSKSSDDDDVIFVTTYTSTTTTSNTTVQANSSIQCTTTGSSISSPSPPKVVRRKRKKKVTVVPRRNPKRVAQMEKASVDLAMKLSMPRRLLSTRTKSNLDLMRNCRQSCRTTGAILSPPRALKSEDWKTWPSEGLHEKPFYNPTTKRLHRFDKNTNFTSNLEEDQTCKCTKGRIEQTKVKVDDDLAISTHHSLHSVLSYVADVKCYNRIRVEAKKRYLGEFWNLFSTVADSNVRDACDVLLDTCKLYCLCNGVSESDMVRYIDSLKPSDVRCDLNKEK